MLEKITEALKKRKVSAWQVRESRRTSHQSFLALNDPECRRLVETQSWVVSLFQLRKDAGGGVLGMSSFKITPPELPEFDRRLEDALFGASLVSNQPFELPEAPGELPSPEIAESDFHPRALKELEDRLRSAVEREPEIRLSAAEFFVDQIETRLVNHRGLDLRQSETTLHTEFILLARHGDRENEFIDRYTRRLSRDFNLEAEIRDSAEMARASARAALPKTGKFPVLITDEPLDHLFNPIVARASARLNYNRIMQTKPGDRVIEGEAAGDKITLWSHPLLPGAMNSYRFDGYGTPARRVCLVQDNVLKGMVADKRYADYLGVPLTGELGNVEVAPGASKFSDLVAPGDGGTLYHLLAFSAFEPNAITGAFSAEIRAGYEITSAGRRPIKGGSVSGVLQRDLARARLSEERAQRESVLAPRGILFESLTIAGA